MNLVLTCRVNNDAFLAPFIDRWCMGAIAACLLDFNTHFAARILRGSMYADAFGRFDLNTLLAPFIDRWCVSAGAAGFLHKHANAPGGIDCRGAHAIASSRPDFHPFGCISNRTDRCPDLAIGDAAIAAARFDGAGSASRRHMAFFNGFIDGRFAVCAC